ncbi:GNAT family N-acetyltransferase [Burkholderia multivorans]|uniref:GNAT family N-acetyltransferase n=1 Tax=Burkholderia multivorans TaxID=87883 RepID=UPI000B5AA940|nr:GNAT family N-acetyltransferase [Burkholderia multivorans]
MKAETEGALDFMPNGRLWRQCGARLRDQLPKIEFSSLVSTPMLKALPLTSESASDRANVLRVFNEASSYTQLVESRSPCAEDVDDFFFSRPMEADVEQKAVFGFYIDMDMVGCTDIIRSYPTDDCFWIGLLLFSEARQGRGHGKAALGLLIEMARGWGYREAQLAVISSNLRAYAFWQREGFTEVRRASNPKFSGDLIVMQRTVYE